MSSKKDTKDPVPAAGQESQGGPRFSPAGYPRARASIARWRSVAALTGFAVVLYASLEAGVPAFESGLRALAGGLAGYVVGWAAAVAIWRQMIRAEITAAVRRRMEGASRGRAGS